MDQCPSPFVILAHFMANCNVSIRTLSATSGISRKRLAALIAGEHDPTLEELQNVNKTLGIINETLTRRLKRQKKHQGHQ